MANSAASQRRAPSPGDNLGPRSTPLPEPSSLTAARRADGAEGFLVCICSDCGYVEGGQAQAGCCRECGVASEPIYAWAIANHRVDAEEAVRLDA